VPFFFSQVPGAPPFLYAVAVFVEVLFSSHPQKYCDLSLVPFSFGLVDLRPFWGLFPRSFSRGGVSLITEFDFSHRHSKGVLSFPHLKSVFSGRSDPPFFFIETTFCLPRDRRTDPGASPPEPFFFCRFLLPSFGEDLKRCLSPCSMIQSFFQTLLFVLPPDPF